MQEWRNYKVGTPSESEKSFNKDCMPFSIVSHVTHIKQSVTVFSDMRIKSNLVYDESKLNESRVQVVWLSPNYWSIGFRYGNVIFSFEPGRLFSQKNYYWVEVINYKIPACRILITDKIYNDLEPYNPISGDGPWWFDPQNQKHFYNGEICLEFMHENDLLIDSDIKTGFVEHNDKYCSLHRNSPSKCKDLGLDSFRASGKFLAEILADEISVSFSHFPIETGETIPKLLKDGLNYLFMVGHKNGVVFSGRFGDDLGTRVILARALCNAIKNRNEKEEKNIVSLFKNIKDLHEALMFLFCNHFNVSYENFEKEVKY